VWSALGGELKPSLDLVLAVPFDTRWSEMAGPPVTGGIHIDFTRTNEPEQAAAEG